MPTLSKNKSKRESCAAPPMPQRAPVIRIAPGGMSRAVDHVAYKLDHLDGIYRYKRELVRARHGLAVTVERLPFSAFVDALDRAFIFRRVRNLYDSFEDCALIDPPPRLCRIIFESPAYWTKIPEIRDPADLAPAGAA